MIPLGKLAAGQRARLCGSPSGADPMLSRRLGELGFVPGTVIQVVRRAPLGDPVELELRGYRVCLRLEQLEGLLVEPLESAPS